MPHSPAIAAIPDLPQTPPPGGWGHERNLRLLLEVRMRIAIIAAPTLGVSGQFGCKALPTLTAP